MLRLFFLSIIIFLVLLPTSESFGSHLRGGQITFRLFDCASNTYDVIVTIYINTLSPVEPGNGILDLGDGTTITVSFSDRSVIDPVNAVGIVTYTIRHKYNLRGGFTVNYTEQNRNAGVLNIPGSDSVPFSIESFILADGNCDKPMTFTIDPIDRACSEFMFTHNPGIVADSDDSISYELVNPLQGLNIPVSGYQNPNSAAFYSGNYQQSNETKNGPPTIQITQEGTLTWNAPGKLGEYGIGIKVSQWKLIDSVWVNTEWVIRDMQVLVMSCNASRPFLVLPPDLCVHPGDDVMKKIRGFQPEMHPVTIQVFTVDDFKSSPPEFLNANVLQSTMSPNDTANIKINWPMSCELVKPQPYKFIFKIISVNNDGIRLFSFQTWQVKVVSRAPVYKSVALNVSKKTLTIQWHPYSCGNSIVEVYRRVDRGGGEVSDCQPGIPRSWGFSKVGSSTINSFTDTHLAAGATYCYRLIAHFSGDQGYSIASKDTCIGPLVIDAPVITKVSVNQTDKINGVVLVKWNSPFEINRTLFPPPYEYTVQRTTDGQHFFTITATQIADTVMVDTKLDVLDSTYGYRVIVYSPTSIAGNNPIDTSALAFYPRLSCQSLENGVRLSWDASVPWSNQTTRYPWHYIYRKEIGSPSFVLIDSVNVETLTEDTEGYYYYDQGSKTGFPINPNTVYTYRIETQGVYGNPKLPEPLQNFSNEIVGQPIDKIPPCAPRLNVQTVSCDDLINGLPCSVKDFTNTIEWVYPESCGNDVAYYRIFVSSTTSSDTVLLTTTTDLKYIHQLPNSLAGCYKVLAVDRSGNRGALSTPFCIENCTHVYLPNVVTVNGDGLNETFPNLIDQTDKRESYKCPRFVKEFSLQIFNRWGEKVYNTQGSPGSAEWHGLDQNGHELSTGIYFYSVNVFFYSLSTEKQSQNFNGSINLLR